jgi:hypothetical protein
MGPKTRRRVLIRFFEFFIIGVLMGVGEDLIAIHFATDAVITPHVFKVAFLVALPFAIISELVVDSKIFRRLVFGPPDDPPKSSKKK